MYLREDTTAECQEIPSFYKKKEVILSEANVKA